MTRPTPGSALRIVVLTAIALSLLAPAAATAARSEFYGIVQGPSLDDKDVQGMRNAHIRTNRYLLAWESVQPDNKNTFSWGLTDKFIGRLAAQGIRTVPAVWGNPSWVSGYQARPPLDSAADITAWRNFLKALVARYKPGGTYWANKYHQQYPNAKPLPIQTWQIWNEPNLKKFFVPYPSAKKYGQLLKISHDAIKNKDPQAQILLGGMPGYGDQTAWDWLNQLYNQVSGVKSYFDLAALHPYAPDLDHVRLEIQKFRTVMGNHGDAATPLWITEIAWGSAPPDRFGINKGPTGQEKMLRTAYKLILQHRKPWNIQRLFWYHWRDPQHSQAGTCSFCGSAGLKKYNRTAKPAFATFKGFTADTSPPVVHFISPPSPTQGSVINDPTPTFKFNVVDTTKDAGSTFQCHVDTNPFKACNSPFTTAALADGAHGFSVKAIDPPGNESAVITRSFTVDTTP